MRGRKVSESQIMEMIKLKRSFMSNKEISNKIGLCASTIGRYLNERMPNYDRYAGIGLSIKSNKPHPRPKKMYPTITFVCPQNHINTIKGKEVFDNGDHNYYPCRECGCAYREELCEFSEGK